MNKLLIWSVLYFCFGWNSRDWFLPYSRGWSSKKSAGNRWTKMSRMTRVHRMLVKFGQVYLYLVLAAWLHRLPNSSYNVWAHSNERVQVYATTGDPPLFEEAGHRCDVFKRLWGWCKANEHHRGGDLGPVSLGSKSTVYCDILDPRLLDIPRPSSTALGFSGVHWANWLWD